MSNYRLMAPSKCQNPYSHCCCNKHAGQPKLKTSPVALACSQPHRRLGRAPRAPRDTAASRAFIVAYFASLRRYGRLARLLLLHLVFGGGCGGDLVWSHSARDGATSIGKQPGCRYWCTGRRAKHEAMHEPHEKWREPGR